MNSLPVDSALDALFEALAEYRRAVLVAPPGSGKTTRVPVALLERLVNKGQVVVTQPRRAAARMVARYVGQQQPRGRVGFEVRGERQSSPATRLTFMTEGVLLARILNDPELSGISAVVIDEFHERSLIADMLLAMVSESASIVREDLWFIVMSATLDSAPVAKFLAPCPVIRAEGRTFPVEVRHAPELTVAGAVREHMGYPERGDALVFLPGIRDILETRRTLPEGIPVDILHGSLSASEQDRVLRYSGPPRVVLTTNIAETSVTLPGVTTVIDSGRVKRLEHDLASGLDGLRIRPISRASAEQRAGRAGRVRAGRAIRLWSAHEHRGRRAFETPDIERLELSSVVLWLKRWGVRDARGFEFFQAPPVAALERSEQLLVDLGAVAEAFGELTDAGERMARIPAHPRMARFLLEALHRGVGRLGCEVAMLLEEPRWFADSASVRGAERADVLRRVRRFRSDGHRHRQATRAVRQLGRVLGATAPDSLDGTDAEEALCAALVAGWPERVAVRRGVGSDAFVLATGRAVRLSKRSSVLDSELVVAVRVGGDGTQAFIESAAGIELRDLEHLSEFSRALEMRWDSGRQRVLAERVTRYGAAVIERVDVPLEDREGASQILVANVGRLGLDAFQLSAATKQLLARLKTTFPEASPWSWIEPCLPRICRGKTACSQIRDAPLDGLIVADLPWDLRDKLERESPKRLRVPSGRDVSVTYRTNAPPTLSVKVQEMFGTTQAPCLGPSRAPVRLELLDPAGRPLAVTDDLAGFWSGAWADVRKQMRGRYPKHRWPENPREAVASVRSTKPRKR